MGICGRSRLVIIHSLYVLSLSSGQRTLPVYQWNHGASTLPYLQLVPVFNPLLNQNYTR